MNTISKLSGGCQCGNIRFVTAGEPIIVAVCHCSMCRRANAAPAVVWAMFKQDQVNFSGEKATQYASSSTARRGFCHRCGTQVSFVADYIPGLIDLTVGSFDSPELLEPSLHYWDAKRLPWLKFADTLPRHAEFPPFE
jgi:hypothetical protein